MSVKEIVNIDRLYNQQSRVRTIRKLQSEIDVISSKLSSPGSVKLTDMPRNQTKFDKVGFLISKKIEKENKLEKLKNEALIESDILKGVINCISNLPEPVQGATNSDYQDLLEYHFMNDMSMKEILELMGIDEDSDNYESYMRLMYARKHDALQKFIKCQRSC